MVHSIDKLEEGQSASFTKTITETDVYLFAGITGDVNPAHIDEEYAKGTHFHERIVHGILLAGLISTVIGVKLPGPGTIYVSQNLNFLSPVYFGDTITASVQVKTINYEKKRVILDTKCKNQEGTVVISGEAIVMPPKK